MLMPMLNLAFNRTTVECKEFVPDSEQIEKILLIELQ